MKKPSTASGGGGGERSEAEGVAPPRVRLPSRGYAARHLPRFAVEDFPVIYPREEVSPCKAGGPSSGHAGWRGGRTQLSDNPKLIPHLPSRTTFPSSRFTKGRPTNLKREAEGPRL